MWRSLPAIATRLILKAVGPAKTPLIATLLLVCARGGWKLGLTQTKLAQAVGVTFQQLQKYEVAINRISVGALHQLRRTLDVPSARTLSMVSAGSDKRRAGQLFDNAGRPGAALRLRLCAMMLASAIFEAIMNKSLLTIIVAMAIAASFDSESRALATITSINIIYLLSRPSAHSQGVRSPEYRETVQKPPEECSSAPPHPRTGSNPNGPTHPQQPSSPIDRAAESGRIFAGGTQTPAPPVHTKPSGVPGPRLDQSHRCKSSGSSGHVGGECGRVALARRTLAAEARADKRCCGHHLVRFGRSLQRLIGDFVAK